jgi:hypothetical protein
MKIDQILTEFVIFVREHDGDCEDCMHRVVRAAEIHLDKLRLARARAIRLSRERRRTFCERCDGPSSSGILCWSCLAVAPAAIRHAFRDARGLEGMREAGANVREWIRGDRRGKFQIPSSKHQGSTKLQRERIAA